jgi:heme O synthase-like polyprenyltransferase
VVLQTALGVVGVVFALVWVYVLWVRRDVARRIAEGSLPGQQTGS